MKKLKVNKFILLLIFISSLSCQTTRPFKIKTFEKDELNIVEVDTNRVIQECYFMNAEKENIWRHQYVLHILNEKNEVISAYHPVNQDKSQCEVQFKKIEKVLKKESRVKLCLRENLEIDTNPNDTTPEFLNFGPLGIHESPYHALTFDTICNSKDCFSISDTWTDTCPDFMPLVKSEGSH